MPKYNKTWESIFNTYSQQKMIKYIEKNSIYLNPNEIIMNTQHFTPLMYACYYNFDLVAEKILEIYGDKCDIYYKDKCKNDIFYYAMRNKLENVIVKLVNIFGYKIINLHYFTDNLETLLFVIHRYGINCNIDNIDSNNNTILMQTCIYKNDILAIKLIEIFGKKCDINHKNYQGNTVFNIAISNKLENVIRKIIDSFGIKNIMNCHNNYNQDTVTYLIENNLLNIENINNDSTLLMWACDNNYDILAIKMIDKYGIECNVGYINKKGKTVFDIAISNKLENVAIKLLNTFKKEYEYEYNCDNKIQYYSSILIDCCKNVMENFIINFIKEFYDKSWNKLIIDIFINKTIIFCLNKNLESIAINILKLINNLFNIEQFNMIDDRLLVKSIENKSLLFTTEIINLINIKFDNSKLSSNYTNGLIYAINNNLYFISIKIIENFSKKFSNNYEELKKFYYIGFICGCDNKFEKILHNIISLIWIHFKFEIDNTFYNELLAYSITNKLENISMSLLNIFGNKCIIDKLNKYNQNTLYLAINNQLINLAKLLINKYTDKCIPEQIDINNNTSFIIACKYKFINIIQMMIEKFADKCKPDQISNDGNTALIWGCRFTDNFDNDNNIINIHISDSISLLLIEKFGNKLNFNIKNNNNKSALDYAIEYNLYSVIKILKTKIIKRPFNCENEKCIMCMDELISTCVLLTGCGHSCYCNECAIDLTNCLICNKPIVDKYEIPIK